MNGLPKIFEKIGFVLFFKKICDTNKQCQSLLQTNKFRFDVFEFLY